MDLSQEQVEKIEEYIAFEGRVELLHWEETSQWGFKVKLGLASRAALDAFDKTMKRSKKRGGQRYHAIFENVTPKTVEAMFCGRGWAESKGAHIALHIPDSKDQQWFRFHKTDDQEGECQSWNIMLLEVAEDETIINQKKRDKAYSVPVGGPRSKAVAMLLQDADFIVWLDTVSVHNQNDSFRTFDGRDALVKNRIGIKSKIELDNGNDQAWTLWEQQFHRPFIQWMQRGNR